MRRRTKHDELLDRLSRLLVECQDLREQVAALRAEVGDLHRQLDRQRTLRVTLHGAKRCRPDA